MSVAPLTCDNIGELNCGRARAAINSVLAQVLADLDERGDDGKERRATITVAIGRINDTSNIYIDVRTKVTMPSLDSGSTIAELIHNGRRIEAHFRPDSPERPDQPTMFEKERQRAKHPEAEDDDAE